MGSWQLYYEHPGAKPDLSPTWAPSSETSQERFQFRGRFPSAPVTACTQPSPSCHGTLLQGLACSPTSRQSGVASLGPWLCVGTCPHALSLAEFQNKGPPLTFCSVERAAAQLLDEQALCPAGGYEVPQRCETRLTAIRPSRHRCPGGEPWVDQWGQGGWSESLGPHFRGPPSTWPGGLPFI